MSEQYDSRTIAFHWISAILVIGLWTLGQCIDFFPRGTPRVMARSLHITFGVLLALLLLARLVWRFGGRGVKLEQATSGYLGSIAVGVHYLLYALMAAVVVIGMWCVWVRGDTLFNLFTVPAFDPANKQLREDAVDLHELAANILLFLAAFHAAAALWHHFVRKDNVLRRMWPGLK